MTSNYDDMIYQSVSSVITLDVCHCMQGYYMKLLFLTQL